MFLIVSWLKDRKFDAHVRHRKSKTHTRNMQNGKETYFRKQCVRTSRPCSYCHLQTAARADRYIRTCIINLLTFFLCTLIPSLNLLWSHRLRCATHFRQSVPVLRQVLRKLRDVRALKFSLSSTWPTVFYLLKLCAKVMLLQCNPKYPRDFHHSSSIKALKCEDLKMQLACLRFQP